MHVSGHDEEQWILVNRRQVAEKIRDIRRIHELDGNPVATDDAGFLVELLDRHHGQLLADLGLGGGEMTSSNSSAAGAAGGESETARAVRGAFGNSRKDVALYGDGRLPRSLSRATRRFS